MGNGLPRHPHEQSHDVKQDANHIVERPYEEIDDGFEEVEVDLLPFADLDDDSREEGGEVLPREHREDEVQEIAPVIAFIAHAEEENKRGDLEDEAP